MRLSAKFVTAIGICVALASCVFAQGQTDKTVDLGTKQEKPARPPRNFAILIGINDYPNLPPEKQLHYAEADAAELKSVLVSKYGFADADVKLLLDATKSDIDTAFGWCQDSLVPEDKLVVFLSCHGAVIVGDYPTLRFDNYPYGGVKRSGFGREGVRFAMDDMTDPKALVERVKGKGFKEGGEWRTAIN